MASTDLVTLVEAVTTEIPKARGSRFIGDARSVAEEDQAMAFVASIRDREPSATHHCWAFALHGGRARSSDDGEPTGTAGPPILRRIGGAGLSDVVVVVTRYYGGTNLGTGGLVRAYGDCAAAVLAAGTVHRKPVLTTYRLTHPYELTAQVETVMASFGATAAEARYTSKVELLVSMPVAGAAGFADAVTDATAGRVRPQPVIS